jgi:alkaline phosphatase
MARVISNNYTVIGWTTHGHNGEDVPVWVYPCSPALGTIDNTLLPRACEGWGGFGPRTLDELTDILYINVEDAFPGEWVLDKTDPENHVLVVKDFARLPISKDLLIIDGKEHRLGSLVVYAPLRDDSNVNTVLEDRVYIPRAAVLKIKFWDKIKACDDDD